MVRWVNGLFVAGWLGLSPAVIWAAIYRFGIPAEGRIEPKHRWESDESDLVFSGLGFLVALVAFSLGARFPFAYVVAIAGVLAGCVFAVRLVRRAPQRRLLADERKRAFEEFKAAADKAARQWEQMDAQVP